LTSRIPRLFGFQAAGAAPFITGERVKNPDTIATAIRIGNPASWDLALAAREDSNGYFGAIDDEGILAAHKLLAKEVGVFVEPSSAISVAGLMERSQAGALEKGATAVLTVTGHGLKDPQWALKNADGSEAEPTKVPVDVAHIAEVLGLRAGA
jgi:threonine synthase